VASSRSLGVLFSLLAVIAVAGCGEDPSAAPPLQATASSSVGCKTGQGYQHTTLGYHLCFPNGWTARDYTAEPGAGGAVSVVAFGPPAAVPAHVPASGVFIPPIEVRVVAGPKDQAEASLALGNQVTQTTVAGTKADKIMVVDSGPANGAVIVVFEHQANTFEIEEAPGGTYDAAFQQVLDSFSFSSS
jgi:ABC-type Fe3+-hydroxamate transport system substrate-binding protein